MSDFAQSPAESPIVELTSPEGKVYQFRYVAIVPYDGQDYVVLMELEKDPTGQEQLLITRLVGQDGDEGGEAAEGLSFEVVADEHIVQEVFDRYVAQNIQAAMEADLPEDDCECGCHDEGCGCHHDDSCGCGHHH